MSQLTFACRVLCVLFFAPSVFAWDIKTGPLQDWLEQVTFNEKAQEQLAPFFRQRNRAELEAYGTAVFEIYKKQLTDGMKKWNMEGEACALQSRVEFASDLTRSGRSDEQEFESEILKMESLDCLVKAPLEKTVALFLSDSFQLRGFPDVKASKSDETTNMVCQKTSVFLLGDSEYCTRNFMWRNDSTVFILSVNEYNGARVSAPVHLRLVTTVFHKMADGRLKMYNLTMGRGPDLPMHSLVKSMAAKQHKAFIEKFTESLLNLKP